MSKPPRDRFDEIPRTSGRVGAHRAEQPRMNGWVVLLWAFVGTIVLVVAGTFATFLATDRITLFPEAGPGGGPEIVEEPGVIDTEYSILVLNGTPDDGLDARTRDLIVNAGWNGNDVVAGPSGTTSFEFTTIYYMFEADLPAARGLAEVIGGADVVQSDYYGDPEDTEAKELTLVLGLDRSSVQPEPEEEPAED